MSFIARIPATPARFIWALWLLLITWSAAGPMRTHVEYFDKLGDGVSVALVAFVVAGAATAWIYSSLRLRRNLWRYEPAAAVAILVVLCLVYEPLAFLVTLGWLWAAFAAGRAIFARIGLPLTLSAGDAGLAAAMGAVWLGVTLYLLGAAHLFNRWTLATLFVLTAAIGRRELSAPPRILQGLHRAWGAAEELRDRSIGISVAYGYLFLGFGLAVALTPAINIDAIREHLRYAQIALEAGWFRPDLIQRTTYYPQGFEVIMGAVQAFGGQPAAELVNPALFLSLLAVCYGIARRAGVGVRAAIIGLALAATVPFLHRTGVIVKNDILLFLFQMSALLAWLRARDERNDRWLWCGVIFLALSLGVKHTAVFGAIPLGLMMLWSTWRRPKLLMGLMAVGLLFGGLWHLRAYRETGNPFFPMGSRHATNQFPSKGVFKRPPLWQVHAVYPWAIHYAGNSSYGSPSNSPAGMTLPFFVIAWLLVRRHRPNRAETAALIFCAIYYVYWGYIWGIVRYFMGPFILLIILTLARAQGFWDSAGLWPRRFGLAALTANFVFAVPVTLMFEINLPQLEYLSGRIDREQFLTKAVSGYRVLRELEKRRAPDDDAISFHMEHLVYAPSQEHLSLMYTGYRRRPRRNQLVATRQFVHIIASPGIDREFHTYDGAEDYERVYSDDAYSLWERKPGVEPREPVTHVLQLVPPAPRRPRN